MGYSGRYHAASLAAVFIALAIGVLIGVGFGNSPRKSLEKSLKGDLKNARKDSDRLGAELSRERDFGSRIYPVLTRDQLPGDKVALVGIGGLPDNISGNVQDALDPTGAKLTEVAVVRLPPSLDGLAERLSKRRFRRVAAGGPGLARYARQAGRQLVTGGSLLDRTRDQLLSRASGSFDGVDDVILVRERPSKLSAAERRHSNTLERGVVAGMHDQASQIVGVERTDTNPSQIDFFKSLQLPSVDDLDLVAGRAALVFTLLGSEGNFGVKGSADRLLPELLSPAKSGG
jgi:hypothetical protein